MWVRTACWLLMVEIAFFAPAFAADPEEVPAPEGFQWQAVKEADGRVLVPEGWHFSRVGERETIAYRVSREQLEDGRFLTGLTVNVLRDVQKRTRLKPSLYAVYHVNEYQKAGDIVEVLVQPGLKRGDPFVQVSCQVVKKMPELDPDKLFRIRVLALADDRTDTLYFLIFGAPKEEWPQHEKLASELMERIVLGGHQLQPCAREERGPQEPSESPR